MMMFLAPFAVHFAAALATLPVSPVPEAPVTLRVATFNVQDLRTTDLAPEPSTRAKALVSIIREIRPNIILLNEVTFDIPGAPGFVEGATAGTNGTRIAEMLAAAGCDIRYAAYSAPTNTGVPSGFDLDNNGAVVTTYPAPAPADAITGAYPPPPPEAVQYANDCWGFGTFPGQYGMVLLVDTRLTIDTANTRTFQRLPWDYVSGAFLPTNPDNTEWFSAEEKAVARLSSKSHWDVPVSLPNGRTLHVICSHPTPPAFDGPEMRNKKRNYDEIRLIADYIDSQPYIVDDNDQPGGLPQDALFVVLGDLNADPDEGDSFKNPIKNVLLANRRISRESAPVSDIPLPGLDPDDTSTFKLRVDYCLPSIGIDVLKSGVFRGKVSGVPDPSDHFPVWIDINVPPPPEGP